MTITHKEIIAGLVEYYLSQDPKMVARLCANFYIDICRMMEFSELDIESQASLQTRLLHNRKNLMKFIKKGCQDDEGLKLTFWEDL